jgi:hypothetical protein
VHAFVVLQRRRSVSWRVLAFSARAAHAAAAVGGDANSWTGIQILGVAVPRRITIMGHTTQSFISPI